MKPTGRRYLWSVKRVPKWYAPPRASCQYVGLLRCPVVLACGWEDRGAFCKNRDDTEDAQAGSYAVELVSVFLPRTSLANSLTYYP